MTTPALIHHLTSLTGALLLATLPAQTPAAPATLTSEQVEAIADAAFQQFAPKGFALTVVQNGKLLIELGRGDRAEGAPMTPTTLCNIASCSKAFTAAAVAMLVQDGKLRWDDHVIDHLPEFRLSDPWITNQLTVRDLLSHRSGLSTFAGDLLWYGCDYDDAEVMTRLARLPITQRFRDQYGYQNLMYAVAGTLVHKRSGLSWEDFVSQRLLLPTGMASSATSADRLAPSAERATPHIDNQPIADHPFRAVKPAASIYASVRDLTAWLRFWLNGGKVGEQAILSEASLRELWRPHVFLGGGSGASTADFRAYGLGWFLSLERGSKLVEHDGGMPGFLSKVSLVPAEQFGFAVLNNADDGALNEAIKRALLLQRAGGDGLAEITRIAALRDKRRQRDVDERKKREAGRIAGTQPSRPLDNYVGRFVDAIYGPAEITLQDGQLELALLPSRQRLHGAMVHWHFDTFRVDWPDRFLPFALVRCELDHTGAVAGFRIDCPIADFDFGALDFRRQAPSAR